MKEEISGYLVFTSFNSGEHTNFFVETNDEATNLISIACKDENESFDAEDEFKEREEEFRESIDAITSVNENVWFELRSGTWFTITKTKISTLGVENA